MFRIFFFVVILLLFSSSAFSQKQYWEDLTENEKDAVLDDKTTAKVIVDYYSGKFRASDDSVTFDLLDEVTKKDITALDFHVFNLVLRKSDGALSEVMGPYCFKLFKSEVKWVMNYFTRDRKGFENDKLYVLYGKHIAWSYENSIKDNSTTLKEFEQFKNLLVSTFKNDSNENKETVNLFIAEMDKIIK